MTVEVKHTIHVDVPRQFELLKVSEFMDETLSWAQSDDSISRVVFDFRHTKWISAEGIVTLSSTIRFLQKLNYEADFILPTVNTSPVLFCNDCDFFDLHFGRGIGTLRSRRSSTFPLGFVSSTSFDQGYVDQLMLWLRATCGAQYSFATLDTALDEVLNNIIDHSGSTTGGVVFAQHYPIKGYIELCISDTGAGIANRIRSSYSSIQTDFDAIRYATNPSVSTKSTPRNRGAGLDTIKTLTELHKGVFRIVANKGVIKWDYTGQPTNEVVHLTDFAYHGTLITLRFPTSTLDEQDESEEDFSW